MLLHETIEFDVAHPVSPYRYVVPLFNSQQNMAFRNVSFHWELVRYIFKILHMVLSTKSHDNMFFDFVFNNNIKGKP